MVFFVRQALMAVAIGVLLFSTSCEKHPIGQMPEVQREQPDPAKVWSNAAEQDSEGHSTSGTPAEVPHESR
jgi:hypothetical protein